MNTYDTLTPTGLNPALLRSVGILPLALVNNSGLIALLDVKDRTQSFLRLLPS